MNIRKSTIRRYLLIGLYCVVFFLPAFTVAQDPIDLQRQYPFLKSRLNDLDNDSAALRYFYDKISQLNSDKNIVVRITHIGDSHIQADLLSGKVRERLQLEYGNAGRGLIVPYKVARTNEPYTYQTCSNVVWKSKRVIAINDSMPIGVGGLTIGTQEAGAILQFKVFNKKGLNYSFNKLTLFHEKCENCFDFDIVDSCGGTVGMLSALSARDSRFESTTSLLDYQNSIALHARIRSFTKLPHTYLYGILVENSRPGILYNSIGINGAEFRHYNKSIYFHEQQAALKPDLVIVSLGTNEAFGRGFDPSTFLQQMDTMIRNLRSANPLSSLLITLPGDHYRSRKYKNPNVPLARKVIIDYCQSSQIAYWDLFEIMGGYGSIAKWHAAGLTSKDLLHLNGKGYEVQGELLFRAIIKGIRKYESSVR